LDRITIIQSLIDTFNYSSYLEIGVNRGYCFFNVRCNLKTAVDPKFKNKSRFDIIFIDGLHTFHQSYIDLLNAMKVLNHDGMILLHDCSPISEASAQDVASIAEARKHPEYAGDWSGAVWKSIVKFRKEFPKISVAVVDADHGVAIIAPDRDNYKKLSGNFKVEDLTYQHLELNRKELLNLVSPTEFQSWIKEFGN